MKNVSFCFVNNITLTKSKISNDMVNISWGGHNLKENNEYMKTNTYVKST